jgi:hypothetical protein
MRNAIVAGLSAVALAFTLTACSDKAKQDAEAAKVAAEKAAQATKEAAMKAAEAAKTATHRRCQGNRGCDQGGRGCDKGRRGFDQGRRGEGRGSGEGRRQEVVWLERVASLTAATLWKNHDAERLTRSWSGANRGRSPTICCRNCVCG